MLRKIEIALQAALTISLIGLALLIGLVVIPAFNHTNKVNDVIIQADKLYDITLTKEQAEVILTGPLIFKKPHDRQVTLKLDHTEQYQNGPRLIETVVER